MKLKFIGSNVCLIFGIISFIGGISQLATDNAHSNNPPLAGLLMVLGALSYKSFKKTKLGIARPSKIRKIFECFALILIIALVLFQKNYLNLLATDPVPNFIIPVWALLAYASLFIYRQKTQEAVDNI